MTFKLILNNVKPKCKPPVFIKKTKIIGYEHYGLFKCYCKNLFETRIRSVLKGLTQSCGCFHKKAVGFTSKTHGHTVKRDKKPSYAYKSWHSMMQRCYNPNRPHYDRYGGRGITVCKRWHIFENFLEDMGEREKGLTIERLENNKNYYKENCIWASRKTQAENRCDNYVIMYKGTSQKLVDVVKHYKIKISISTIKTRLRRCWSVEDALHTPIVIGRPKHHDIRGLHKSAA